MRIPQKPRPIQGQCKKKTQTKQHTGLSPSVGIGHRAPAPVAPDLLLDGAGGDGRRVSPHGTADRAATPDPVELLPGEALGIEEQIAGASALGCHGRGAVDVARTGQQAELGARVRGHEGRLEAAAPGEALVVAGLALLGEQLRRHARRRGVAVQQEQGVVRLGARQVLRIEGGQLTGCEIFILDSLR